MEPRSSNLQLNSCRLAGPSSEAFILSSSASAAVPRGRTHRVAVRAQQGYCHSRARARECGRPSHRPLAHDAHGARVYEHAASHAGRRRRLCCCCCRRRSRCYRPRCCPCCTSRRCHCAFVTGRRTCNVINRVTFHPYSLLNLLSVDSRVPDWWFETRAGPGRLHVYLHHTQPRAYTRT